jgi:Type VI secretion system, VipA, VC_A0107 or Hcp2
MQDYGIGGNMAPDNQAAEGFRMLSNNRTLMVQKLNADEGGLPEPVMGLQTLGDVFAHFKPSVFVSLADTSGEENDEELNFENMTHFTKDGISSQSRVLQKLKNDKNDFAKMQKALKTNKSLDNILKNADSKEALVQALQALIQELDNVQ